MLHSLFRAATGDLDRVAIIDDDVPASYRDLVSAASSVRAGLLRDRESLVEDRVAFLAPAGFDYVATLFGIWSAGGVAVPLHPRHPQPELEYVLDDSQSSMLIAAEEFASLAGSIGTPRKVLVESIEALRETRVASADLPMPSAGRRALILYTSGSTGRPKGVVTTHANLCAQVGALVDAWSWTSDDRILHVLPLHHVHGIVNVLLCALHSGATCEFAHPFDPETVWERFASGGLSLFMAVPTVYAKLVSRFDRADAETQARWSDAARDMRLHVSGSASLPVPVLERWESITGQRLLERYGMTEIGMALSNPLHGERRAGFVGVPLPGVEIRRSGEDGLAVRDVEPGEVEVRGDSVFLEYWNRADETTASFREGWFRTGDIAVVNDGSYRILGRSSVDIIKTGGYKVSALEIEDVLRAHPAIADCAVVGVADDEWGERVAVCVVSSEESKSDAIALDAIALDAITLDGMRAWAKERIAPYKVPSLFRVCEELPRNAMGKVQKRRVRELFDDPDELHELDR